MALGSGISVSIGGSSGDTVHVNNQPMIVLLVPFRKRGGCIRGREGPRGEGYTTNFFSSYLFLWFSLSAYRLLTHLLLPIIIPLIT